MKEIQYKDFSLRIHKKNWLRGKSNVCQFELTFKCGLCCKHCYSDCYNTPHYTKKELSTKEVKSILDKVYDSGIIWLCFTGGDPLTRGDFLDIYFYAKEKGFITTVFTNGYSMTEKIADDLKRRPPFVIEITLNAVTEKTYEDISGINGSFKKTMAGIDMIIKRKLPLKIKTQVTKQNLEELDVIKEFVEGLGLEFRPGFMLYARLNGDTLPCSLRITPQQALDINPIKRGKKPASSKNREDRLFRCAIGTTDGFCIDPYGNMITCSSIRKPAVNLLKNSISKAHNELFSKIRNYFETNSKCRYCEIKDLCGLCPGQAFLETGNMESSIEYFCELARLVKRKSA